ncbi:Protein phosphatase methylesterase 1 [Collariella sp. IMI 366227]|nr:Protein phosphatase methylesterase 1 [Collariella sp. IMI 366227]
MSDLQKKWAKTKFSNTMHAMAPPPMPEFDELDEDRYGSGSFVPNTPQDDDSSTKHQTSEDLTLPTLALDLLTILTLTKSTLHWPSLPPILLVGHSLGGAVVTELASSFSTPPHPFFHRPCHSSRRRRIDLLGYAVLDVVEGSAMDALQSMHAYLTIGQMQGKYALQVFPEAGHFIHEDLPEKTAIALVDFHRRNDRSALVLPPKVSDLLAQGKRV